MKEFNNLGDQTIDERCREYGVSMLWLARKTRIHYHRFYGGYDLRPDEMERVEAIFDILRHRQRQRVVAV